ncbi:hypothetical protein H6CHR_02942 [Variovorax sp. PBL-H6]|uniref:ADP-ribosyltransferase n=1 Tax=Variovorax sp. PBL-H6 TaxID=434009 RepID=UPI001318F520|nr:ADP-ribosyltransferase [Variovorax sp. PBL-H6]VTU28212.1 hypothetical protein H6CHR_02942 [Variovorax sp. PBL-H6]
MFDENLKPGDVFTDPAFVSTSTSQAVAERKFEGRYLLKIINVPGDVPRWRDISSFTGNSAEAEVLGLPNTTFKVVSREVSARQVPCGDNGQMIDQEIITLEPIIIN